MKWNKIKNVKAELEKIWTDNPEQRGNLPSPRWLKDNGYEYLTGGIYRHYGSFKEMREKLGFGGGERKSYWAVPENVIAEARTYMTERGYEKLPPIRIMHADGRTDLASGITRNHSFKKIRAALGEEVSFVNKEYSKRPTNIESARKKIEYVMKRYKLKKIPGKDKLRELGFGSLANFIDTNGGFSHFREENGGRKKAPNGALRDKNYILEESVRVMEVEGWDELPSPTELARRGYSSLMVAISQNHGGFRAFRDELRVHSGKSRGSDKLSLMLEEYTRGKV